MQTTPESPESNKMTTAINGCPQIDVSKDKCHA